LRYATAAAFRTALETRLLAGSRNGTESITRLRKHVVFDRLLARLLLDPDNHWVLKGGLALDYRFGSRARTTKDADLTGPDSESRATSALIAVQSVDLGDFFEFEVQRTGHLDQIREGAAVRYRVRAFLAGRLFEEGIVDVGFGLAPIWEPELIIGRNLLSFAGIEPVTAPTLPLELQVAEKVHAYTGTYGEGVGSTRVKDLVDLAMIAQTSAMDGDRLATALRVTFDQRGRQALAKDLPAPPADWRIAYRRLAGEVGVSTEVLDGFQIAAQLLEPAMRGVSRGKRWDPSSRTWAAGSGPQSRAEHGSDV